METLHATSAMLCMNQKTLSVLRGLSGLGVSSLKFLRGLGVRIQEDRK